MVMPVPEYRPSMASGPLPHHVVVKLRPFHWLVPAMLVAILLRVCVGDTMWLVLNDCLTTIIAMYVVQSMNQNTSAGLSCLPALIIACTITALLGVYRDVGMAFAYKAVCSGGGHGAVANRDRRDRFLADVEAYRHDAQIVGLPVRPGMQATTSVSYGAPMSLWEAWTDSSPYQHDAAHSYPDNLQTSSPAAPVAFRDVAEPATRSTSTDQTERDSNGAQASSTDGHTGSSKAATEGASQNQASDAEASDKVEKGESGQEGSAFEPPATTMTATSTDWVGMEPTSVAPPFAADGVNDGVEEDSSDSAERCGGFALLLPLAIAVQCVLEGLVAGVAFRAWKSWQSGDYNSLGPERGGGDDFPQPDVLPDDFPQPDVLPDEMDELMLQRALEASRAEVRGAQAETDDASLQLALQMSLQDQAEDEELQRALAASQQEEEARRFEQ